MDICVLLIEYLLGTQSNVEVTHDHPMDDMKLSLNCFIDMRYTQVGY